MTESSFIVLTPAQAKRLAKTLAKARSAVDLVAMQLVAIGVSNMVEKLKAKIKKPRKAKTSKPAKPAALKAPAKPGDDITA